MRHDARKNCRPGSLLDGDVSDGHAWRNQPYRARNHHRRLDLTHRGSLRLLEEHDGRAELEVRTKNLPLPQTQAVSGEFACLLSVR